ncbi:MAG: GGDEF domain-containing protein [Burkholderiales bacterium]|nr:GGDEF domain-containing protein [Burkholderiales bacterium]
MQTSGTQASDPAPPRTDGEAEAVPLQLVWRRYVFLLLSLALACALALIVPRLLLPETGVGGQVLLGVTLFLLLGAPAIWFRLLAPLIQDHRERLADYAARTRLAEDRLRAHENNARLEHALEIAEDEGAVLRIAEQALSALANDGGAQLLLANDADGDIEQNITVGDMASAARCTIRRPRDCPTVRRGQGLVYEDSMSLSACAGLSGKIDSSCAAACTPVFVGGQGTGMLRALGQTGDAALYRQLQSLTFNAHLIGRRLGAIRSMAASEAKATTDPLTGLSNRRVLEAGLTRLIHQRARFALVLTDIDHFKKVNDTHGHDVGDRTLKLFAATLKQFVRREDLVCRVGGEEFVMLLAGLDASHGATLVERVRTELPRATARDKVPAFTISAGVVDEQDGSDAETLLRVADGLLYEAKASGRDRVVVSPRVETDAAPAHGAGAGD